VSRRIRSKGEKRAWASEKPGGPRSPDSGSDERPVVKNGKKTPTSDCCCTEGGGKEGGGGEAGTRWTKGTDAKKGLTGRKTSQQRVRSPEIFIRSTGRVDKGVTRILPACNLLRRSRSPAKKRKQR